jgi:hypothetical protein
VVFDQKDCVFLSRFAGTRRPAVVIKPAINRPQHEIDPGGLGHQPFVAPNEQLTKIRPPAKHARAGELQYPSLDEGLFCPATVLRCCFSRQQFQIANLPAGENRIQVWHEQGPVPRGSRPKGWARPIQLT